MIFTNSFINLIKKVTAAAIAAVMLFSLAACAAEDPLDAQASIPVAKELEMNDNATTKNSAGAGNKGVITFSMLKPTDSFFPLGNMSEDQSNVFSMIFEPAVRVSATGEFEGSVVESWKVSDDGRTYRFKVRDGVYFHGDNGQVTAADLAYAINWILGGRIDIVTKDATTAEEATTSSSATADTSSEAGDSAGGESGYGYGSDTTGTALITTGTAKQGSTATATDSAGNADTGDRSPYTKYGKKVTGITVEGTDYLTLTTSGSTPDIFYLMSFPVIPKSYYEGKEDETKRKPVGTNAYYVTEYTDDGGFTLALNSKWWRGNPVYSGVNVKPVDSEEAKLSDYQLGLYDGTATDLMTVSSLSQNNSTSVHSVVTPDYNCLLPNMRNEFLAKKEVRQAISYALDRSAIIMNSVLGEGLETESALRPDLSYFNKSTNIVNGNNITKANSILDDLGYQVDETTNMRYTENDDGTKRWLKFNIIYTESKELYYRRSILDTVQQQLAKVGIDVTIVEKTADEYKAMLSAKTFDMALCDFYMKANNDVTFLFDDYNYGEYSGQSLAGLLSATRTAKNTDELNSAYLSLQEYLVENLPQIGLFFREHALVLKSKIHLSDTLKMDSVYADIGMWSS